MNPLIELGADESRLAELAVAAADRPGTVPGRVVRSERGGADVATAGGPVTAATTEPVCAGDWVLLDTAGDPPRVAAVLPRRTAVVRRAADTDTAQVLAANVDQVWVIAALDRPLGLSRVERALVLAWDSGAEPVVVATKSDLADEGAVADAVASLAVAAPGVPVVAVSAATGDGIADLRARLGRGRTAAVLGPSGAGKSSLVNAVAGDPAVAVGDVRSADGKGRHTTAWRELVVAGDAGILIDSPGLRAVGVWVDGGGIDAAFADVAALSDECRFSDCGHAGEPGCAVAAAIDAGDLDPRRLDSYRKLQREAAWIEQRHDARQRAAERRVWAARSREARRRARPR